MINHAVMNRFDLLKASINSDFTQSICIVYGYYSMKFQTWISAIAHTHTKINAKKTTWLFFHYSKECSVEFHVIYDMYDVRTMWDRVRECWARVPLVLICITYMKKGGILTHIVDNSFKWTPLDLLECACENVL